MYPRLFSRAGFLSIACLNILFNPVRAVEIVDCGTRLVSDMPQGYTLVTESNGDSGYVNGITGYRYGIHWEASRQGGVSDEKLNERSYSLSLNGSEFQQCSRHLDGYGRWVNNITCGKYRLANSFGNIESYRDFRHGLGILNQNNEEISFDLVDTKMNEGGNCFAGGLRIKTWITYFTFINKDSGIKAVLKATQAKAWKIRKMNFDF